MTRTTEAQCEGQAWMGTLLRLVDRLERLAAELEAIQLRQRVLVEQDDGDALLDALAHRQAVLEEMTRCADELAPLRERSFATGAGEGVRRRLEAVAAVAASIAADDVRDQERLRERRDSAARQLAEVERGRGALAAYARRGQGVGADFQDTEA